MNGSSSVRVQTARPHVDSSPDRTARLGLLAIGLVFAAAPLHGQDRAGYRDFQLGTTVASVSALTHVAPSQAKTIHQRPAVLQELEWRPRFTSGSVPAPADPVRQIVFSFYDDQLSKLVVDYEKERTEGMTEADMIDGISAMYGPAVLAVSKKPTAASRQDADSGTPVATWGDADYAVVLYRSTDYYEHSALRFRVIVTSSRLDALAQTAAAQAVRLDAQEAPSVSSRNRRRILKTAARRGRKPASQTRLRFGRKPPDRCTHS
jgi:hypothetical protein